MATRLIRQWWTRSDPAQLLRAEERLLSSLVEAPFSSGNAHGLNHVEFWSPSGSSGGGCRESLATVVLAHGFGSGLGFFFRNVDPLLRSGRVRRVILVDWLGMGGSDRPPCRRPVRGLWGDASAAWCDSRFTPRQAVDFFLDPLEHFWHRIVVDGRDNDGAGEAWLVGHSLGGYLAARFALRRPDRLSKLVLASPVGFPPKPTDSLPSSQLPTTLRLVDALWSANVTPQTLVRAMGSARGRASVGRALRGRIPHLDGRDADLLAEYLYHITVAHPSGEFAMNSLLEPAASPDVMGVFAREPLEGKDVALADALDPSVSLRVLYGDQDWMRPNEPSARSVAGQLVQRGSDATVDVVSGAGHHLYLDNPDDFVRGIMA